MGKFNNFRYIGKSRSEEKNDSVIRIALLGDSYVESLQIFERHYFGVIAEDILNEKLISKKVEILNFGQAGYDIGDMYASHLSLVDSFHPDYVIYFLSDEDLTVKYNDPLRPRTVIKNDSLDIYYNFNMSEINRFNLSKKLIQTSTFLNMLKNSREKAMKGSLAEILFEKYYYLYKLFFLETDSKDINNSKEFKMDSISRKILVNLKRKNVIIVNREEFKKPLRFESMLNEYGFKYIDFSIPLNELSSEGFDPKYWKITSKRFHWNHRAHQKLGEYLAVGLEDMLIKESRSR